MTPARLALLVLFCPILTAIAFSQRTLAAPAVPPASIAAVDFGYGGALPYERWGPLRVSIVGNVAAFTGRLEVRYRQDALQSQIISVPASAAAGASIPVEVVINLPLHVEEIVVTLLDGKGRPVDRAVYGQLSTTSPAAMIPLKLDQGDGLVACVGRVSAAESVRARWFGVTGEVYSYNYQVLAPKNLAEMEVIRRKRSARLRAVTVKPEALSTSWAAYDSLEALIVRTEETSEKINEDSRNAILHWVQGGGRLILQVDQIGEAWSKWVGPATASQIVIGDQVRIEVPKAAEKALSAPVLVDTLSRQDEEKIAKGQVLDTPRRPDDVVELVDPGLAIPQELREKLVPASTFPARTVQISEGLRRSGWTTAWSSDGKSVIAQGPCGFGYVTIIGCDPAFAAAVPNHEASYRLWLNVLQAPLEDWVSCHDLGVSTRTSYWRALSSSGANEFQRQAISLALNKVAEGPAGSFNPFVVIGGVAGCILLLALFIGPLDAILLRRASLRHVSWVTALTWIGLMTVLATYAPRIVRGDLKSIIIREKVIDQISERPAWLATATGFFSGRPGYQPLEFNEPAIFLRGASVSDGYARSGDLFPPIRSEQTSLISGSSRISTSIPQGVDQRQWTFRSHIEEGTSVHQEPLGVSFGKSSSACKVKVTFPAGTGASEFRSASLRVGAKTYSIQSSGWGEGETPSLDLQFPALAESGTSQTDWNQFWGMFSSQALPSSASSWVEHLPGAERRKLAIELYMRTGNWALLTLTLRSVTADIKLAEADARYLTDSTYRILIPLKEAPSTEAPHD